MRQGLNPHLFLFFKKGLYEVKASGLQLSSNIFRYPSTWHAIKTNCIKLWTIDQEICSISYFLERGLGIVSPPHFVYDFSRKIILMLYFIKLSNFLFDCLHLLFVSQVVTLSILKLFLSFWSSRFSAWPKSQDKNILRAKRGFKVNQKAFFIIFKGLSVAKNCLRLESAFLKTFYCMCQSHFIIFLHA